MIYKITVKQVTADKDLDWDDHLDNPTGEHFFEAGSKDEALDEFHSTVPIACLDDFEIHAEVS